MLSKMLLIKMGWVSGRILLEWNENLFE